MTVDGERHPLFLVGPGRLGCNLLHAFELNPLIDLKGVLYFSDSGAERARRWTKAQLFDIRKGIPDLSPAQSIVLSVKDDHIKETAMRLSSHLNPGQVLLHTSGRHGSQIFDNCELKCAYGAFHPLQTFGDPRQACARFEACYIVCDGHHPALQRSRWLAAQLGAEMVPLSGDEKINTAYHCAAVMAANYLVSMTSAAVMLGERAGLSPEKCIHMLQPLQRGTLDAVQEEGVGGALTGPIARGDVDTVIAHLDLIVTDLPQLRDLYIEAGLFALSIARKQRGDIREYDEIETELKKRKAEPLNKDIIE